MRLDRVARALARRGFKLYESGVALLPNPRAASRLSLLEDVLREAVPAALAFQPDEFKSKVSAFVDSLRVDRFAYRYSPSAKEPSLYSSVHACLTLSLLRELESMPPEQQGNVIDILTAYVSGPLFTHRRTP